MCGIVGVASQAHLEHEDWLTRARKSIQHRGPDDAGEWWGADGRVGLAHQRLAIVDLSSAAHQPMADRSGEVCIVFNGEIYNFQDLRLQLAAVGHSFVSKSDTEVVLAAYREWGLQCLARLNGMFAFSLYDARHHLLFLARDRAGEKPLYYSLDRGTIRFASELKALLVDRSWPRRIDQQSLDYYLAEGYVPGSRSMVEGIRKLPPAHALTFDLEGGQAHLWRYWQVPSLSQSARHSSVNVESLTDELESLLQEAVGRQLIADVPVGVLLSGGVDSSLVTAMAVRGNRRVKTFTVRFPSHGRYDETEHARLVAQYLATEHVELEAETATVDLLPVLARQFDDPLIDSSMIPTYLVSRLVRQHCTVALGGDGGDELFGGYSHYDRLLRMQAMTRWLPQPVRTTLGRIAGALLPVGTRGRNWLQGLSADLRVEVPLIAQYFDRMTRRRLMKHEGVWPLVAEQIRHTYRPGGEDLLQRATRLDFETYLAEDILVKVDRASMLNSLEMRAPMLDVSVIEFAFSKVPSHLKATTTERKVLLKNLVSRLLPPSFDRKRKQGFSVPLPSWLASGSWQKYFREVLFDKDQMLFDHRCVEKLLAGQARGRLNSERLFGLVMFELWRREYEVSI